MHNGITGIFKLTQPLLHYCIRVKRFKFTDPPYFTCIVRPVKRDWAVLSKDTPLDISIYKSVRQGVFIHLCKYVYTCSHCEKRESRINLDNKETD